MPLLPIENPGYGDASVAEALPTELDEWRMALRRRLIAARGNTYTYTDPDAVVSRAGGSIDDNGSIVIPWNSYKDPAHAQIGPTIGDGARQNEGPANDTVTSRMGSDSNTAGGSGGYGSQRNNQMGSSFVNGPGMDINFGGMPNFLTGGGSTWWQRALQTGIGMAGSALGGPMVGLLAGQAARWGLNRMSGGSDPFGVGDTAALYAPDGSHLNDGVSRTSRTPNGIINGAGYTAFNGVGGDGFTGILAPTPEYGTDMTRASNAAVGNATSGNNRTNGSTGRAMTTSNYSSGGGNSNGGTRIKERIKKDDH